MTNYLLVLSSSGQPPEAITMAVDFARDRGAKLIAIFIMDAGVPAAIFDKLTDIGFIGEKPGTELEQAVSVEYRRQAEATLAEVERLAAEKGIAAEAEIVEGDFVEESLRAVAKYAVDVLIIVRARRTFLSRFLGASGFNELVRSAPCEIKVFEA